MPAISLETRLREMDEEELLEYLRTECNDQVDESMFQNQEEILNYIVSVYHSELMDALHSEHQDFDYSPMHPNKTVEEFLEHEDH
jgi:hypothetical protein